MNKENKGPAWHGEGFRLYCLGLTSKEVAKLLDVSYRTVQGLMGRENWKEQRQTIRERKERRIINRIKRELKND